MDLTRRFLVACLFAIAGHPRFVPAQTGPAGRVAHGIAYDSLRGVALGGAVIMVAGSARATTTDVAGRFRFDTLPPGSYLFSIQHPSLDSIGFSEWNARATVTDHDTLRLFVPSFGTLWRAACQRPSPPADADLIFGTIHTVGQPRPVAGAVISVSWVEIVADEKTGIATKPFGGTVHSDSSGAYRICDAPHGVALQLSATADSATTDVLDLAVNPARVQRRDLTLGSARSADREMRGVITGLIRDADERPLAAARVMTDGAPEARSAADGRFVLRGVPAGTRQVRVTAIGASPTTAIVDVLPPDSAVLDIKLSKAIVLDTTRVVAKSVRQLRVRDIDERRKLGLGHFMDSTAIAGHADVVSAVSEFPGSRCFSTLWIDKVKISPEDVAIELRLLRPDAVAAIEWYERDTPALFGKRPCTLVIWTKFYLPH